MASKRDKDLKQPDSFQRAGLEASSWIEGKEKLILGAVIALVVVGGGIALADYAKDRSQRSAFEDLGAALEPANRPVAEPGAPPEENVDEDKKPFASQKEKDEATIASLQKFRDEHKGTKSAATAALPLAEALYRQGRYDDAAKAFGDYLEGAAKDDLLRSVALEGQGYSFEAKGDYDKAIASYDELAKNEGMLEGMGQLHKARVLILQGKKDEAAKALADIPGSYPNTAAARMATERMNLLASQGVKVPPPTPPKNVPDAGVAQGS